MSDTKINIAVVCENHNDEQLVVATENDSGPYNIKLFVSACPQCLGDPLNAPPKTAELIFNGSNFTSQVIEV